MSKPPVKQSGEVPPANVNDPLADELAKRLKSLLPPGGQQAQIVAQVVSLVQAERFSGPIAHPRHLREYEEIVPGSANRIIEMAEGDLAHSQRLQNFVFEAEIADQREGRRLGFLALLALIASALYCGVNGHELLAGGFIGAGALGVVGAFIRGRNGKNGS